MKKIYKARNALVHGSYMDLDKYGDYHNKKIQLIPIVQKCLLKYIEKMINFHDLKEPYLIAEIGINHNGDINIAKKLIDSANACN